LGCYVLMGKIKILYTTHTPKTHRKPFERTPVHRHIHHQLIENAYRYFRRDFGIQDTPVVIYPVAPKNKKVRIRDCWFTDKCKGPYESLEMSDYFSTKINKTMRRSRIPNSLLKHIMKYRRKQGVSDTTVIVDARLKDEVRAAFAPLRETIDDKFQ